MSVGSEIELSTGTVSLANVVTNDEWIYEHIENYSKNEKISDVEGNSFDNVQPRDTCTLIKTVQYTGNLNAKAFYTVSQDFKGLRRLFTSSFHRACPNDWHDRT